MVENNAGERLCQYPWIGLQDEVDDALTFKCSQILDVSAGPQFHKVLYAWRIRRGDYRGGKSFESGLYSSVMLTLIRSGIHPPREAAAAANRQRWIDRPQFPCRNGRISGLNQRPVVRRGGPGVDTVGQACGWQRRRDGPRYKEGETGWHPGDPHPTGAHPGGHQGRVPGGGGEGGIAAQRWILCVIFGSFLVCFVGERSPAFWLLRIRLM